MYGASYPSDEYASEAHHVTQRRSLSAPSQVLSDPGLSIEEKRALLASWASDLRAVENRPALRRLDDGTVLAIDDILDALKTLDRSASARLQQSQTQSIRRRRPLRGDAKRALCP